MVVHRWASTSMRGRSGRADPRRMAIDALVFTLADLPDRGLTRKQLRQSLAAGTVRRVLRGVYADGRAPDSVGLRARAVAAVVSPGQVVCDRTAAWVHGIDVLAFGEHDILPPVEVCALRGKEPTRRDGVHGRTRDLAPDDVMECEGLLVTTPLRTALDLGCHLRRRDALAALDQFARVFGFSRDQLTREARRYRRRRGVVQLRFLIPLVDPLAESPRESWTRLEILDAGLPEPELQVWVEEHGVPVFRLDLAYPRHFVAVEYDGAEFHDRTEDQRRADEERRDWLRRRGWTVIVVRRGDFAGDASDRWIRELREALAGATYSNLRF